MAILLAMCTLVSAAMPVEMARAAKKSPYYVEVNRLSNVVTVYGQDKKGKYSVPVKAMLCSVGVKGKTPKGTFSIYAKYRWRPLFYGVYGQYACRINGPILFHSVTYTGQDPSKLEYKEFNKLGTSASHGCIRLAVEDARWIYNNCPNGTVVKVLDSKKADPLGKPAMVKIPEKSKYRGWDPTDPNPNNPWRKVAPKITAKSVITVEKGTKEKKVLSMATATNFKGKKVKVSLKGKYNLNEPGTYKAYFYAKDFLGNSSKKNVKIIVRDTEKPKLEADEVEIAVTQEQVEQYLEDDLETGLNTYLGEFVRATKDDIELDKECLIFDTEELIDGILAQAYGEYEVEVYAEDSYGNKSKKKYLTIQYTP